MRASVTRRSLFVAAAGLALLGTWTGYQWNWIAQRRQMLSNREVIDLVGSSVTCTQEAFEKIWAVEGRSAASAPGFLWLFGEPGITELRIFIRDWDQSIPCEEYEVSKRARRLFPEARPTWGCLTR